MTRIPACERPRRESFSRHSASIPMRAHLPTIFDFPKAHGFFSFDYVSPKVQFLSAESLFLIEPFDIILHLHY